MTDKRKKTGWHTYKMMNNPLASASIAVTVLWAGTAAVNASFLQPDTHPAPIFATRGMAVLPADSVRGDRPITPQSNVTASILESDPLLEELQIALSEKQFYAHKLDGKMGPKTRSAIFAYQRAAKLEETGEPSGKLLAHVRMSNVRGNVTLAAPEPRQAPAKVGSPDEDLLMRIQTGLQRYGVAELEVDGIYGSNTAKAIRDFERQHNLPITGKPNTEILRTLIDIGAL